MFVRWESQSVKADHDPRLPGFSEDVVVRRFNAPEALETRFHEIRTKSAINRVPPASRVPFEWTINPYRGCTHACAYCFARPTHEYLDLNAGRDFEREIVVKVNVPEVLRTELARRSWKRETVALGTNTDPYQWVEGRYKLMRGIWEAMRDFANPCSILTKAPLMPGINDAPEQVAAIVEAATEAGAVHIGGNTLFLRGAVRDIFFEWLREHRPDLVERYERLYARGAYLPVDERRTIERAAGAPWASRSYATRFKHRTSA